MPGHTGPPVSINVFASRNATEMSEAAEHMEGQLVGKMSEAVLPVSSEVRGLRLALAANRVRRKRSTPEKIISEWRVTGPAHPLRWGE
jgi:hypothetical protein